MLQQTQPRPERPAIGFRASGFTLLEIMIVLSLLALLAAFAWPNLQKQITAAELPQSAEQLRSTLYMARSEAVMEHRRFRVRFTPAEQQPFVEWEPDPIQAPGVWEPAKSAWTKEPVLLADVQVHRVSIGRPEWTWPVSTTSQDEQELAKAEKRRLEQSDEEKIQEQKFLRGAQTDSQNDQDDDQYRPMIVFGSDGSTEWATFILARLDPAEELTEEMEQVWVLLDGRTGLATIREQVTEEQLADPNFYVAREKLDLPETMDVDDLAFEIGGETGSTGDGQDLANQAAQGLLSSDGQGTSFGMPPGQVGGSGQGPPTAMQGASDSQTSASGTGNRQAGGRGSATRGGTGATSDHDSNGSKPEDDPDDPNAAQKER